MSRYADMTAIQTAQISKRRHGYVMGTFLGRRDVFNTSLRDLCYPGSFVNSVRDLILYRQIHYPRTRIVDFGKRIVSAQESVDSARAIYEKPVGDKDVVHPMFVPQRPQDILDAYVRLVSSLIFSSMNDQHDKSIPRIPLKRLVPQNPAEGSEVSRENHVHVPCILLVRQNLVSLCRTSFNRWRCREHIRVAGGNPPNRRPFHASTHRALVIGDKLRVRRVSRHISLQHDRRLAFPRDSVHQLVEASRHRSRTPIIAEHTVEIHGLAVFHRTDDVAPKFNCLAPLATTDRCCAQ